MSGTIETPSGKGAGDENFQVGSWLLPAALRPHVAAFYAFVRAADDIGDNPALAPDDKIARLDAFAHALTGDGEAAAALPRARALRASLAVTGVTPQHALDLLAAFKRDATKLRYDDWQDLLGYCAVSASPVGRYLLDLHGEQPELYAYSDPLCDALQVLNHLQDCQGDYRALNRVYLPLDSFVAAGIEVDELDKPAASPAMREVLDRALDGVDGLLATARHLPYVLANRRLAAESGVIVAIARRLAAELRRRDPLAERVELGKPQFLLCSVSGLWAALMPRRLCAQPPASVAPSRSRRAMSADPSAIGGIAAARDLAASQEHVRAVVADSGTSFYWGMRLLPAIKRNAMYAIYAFCREVDDIADSEACPAGKRAELASWRAEIEALYAGRPSRPTSVALAAPIERFDLPRADFDAMIDGMEMDASEAMRAPPMAMLERYCRCVAGAVGVLSVRVFGARAPDRDAGAVALGDALQLTNILRDLAEDARFGRLYLPRELLERHGIASDDPARVLRHPALPAVCRELATRAAERFDAADRWLAREERRLVRPALIMRGVYRRTLERLLANDWRQLDPPVRLGRAERLWVAIRHGLF